MIEPLSSVRLVVGGTKRVAVIDASPIEICQALPPKVATLVAWDGSLDVQQATHARACCRNVIIAGKVTSTTLDRFNEYGWETLRRAPFIFMRRGSTVAASRVNQLKRASDIGKAIELLSARDALIVISTPALAPFAVSSGARVLVARADTPDAAIPPIAPSDAASDHGNALEPWRVDRIRALRADRLPSEVICDRLGISPRSVRKYVSALGFARWCEQCGRRLHGVEDTTCYVCRGWRESTRNKRPWP